MRHDALEACGRAIRSFLRRHHTSWVRTCEKFSYKQMVRSLTYLMVTTRPDTYYAIGKFSQRNQDPCTHDWIAVKRTMRYINGTRDFGILFDGSKPLMTDGFCYADWGGCKLSRKSTSGIIFLVAGRAVSWRSKKQTCGAISTFEEEYVAAFLATK